jgi:diketogulonate reductase-like aldo/keto reductase
MSVASCSGCHCTPTTNDDMAELHSLSGGATVATDQILYNLTRRGPEYDLLPWCAEHGVPVMAYSPIEQGRLLGDPTPGEVARWHGATPAQIALAWALRRPGTIAIPRSGNPEHVRENAAARDITLTGDGLAALDAGYPPPRRPQPLEML